MNNKCIYVISYGGNETGYLPQCEAYKSAEKAALCFKRCDSIGAEPTMECIWEYTEEGKNPAYKFYEEERLQG